MTISRSCIFSAALVIVIASCAPPAQVAAAKKAPVPAAKPKPVRMNGRGKITSISLTDFFALQQSGKVLLYDARPGFFYGLSHIPGAISVPKSDCEAQIVKREAEIKGALAEKKVIVVYCTNLLCPDARAVATHLADYGYSSSTLTGGWESYKETGLPTE